MCAHLRGLTSHLTPGENELPTNHLLIWSRSHAQVETCLPHRQTGGAQALTLSCNMPSNHRHQIICAIKQPLFYPANSWLSLKPTFNLTPSLLSIRIRESLLWSAKPLVWNSTMISSPVIWNSCPMLARHSPPAACRIIWQNTQTPWRRLVVALHQRFSGV